jgi:hypothetical protein
LGDTGKPLSAAAVNPRNPEHFMRDLLTLATFLLIVASPLDAASADTAGQL